MVTKFERIGPELQRYDVFLDQLSETARANLCWRTAEKIYGGNKGKVGGGNRNPVPAWQDILKGAPGSD